MTKARGLERRNVRRKVKGDGWDSVSDHYAWAPSCVRTEYSFQTEWFKFRRVKRALRYQTLLLTGHALRRPRSMCLSC